MLILLRITVVNGVLLVKYAQPRMNTSIEGIFRAIFFKKKDYLFLILMILLDFILSNYIYYVFIRFIVYIIINIILYSF